MPLDWTQTVATASTLTSTAAALTSIGFGIAKASTKLGFSIARSIASITSIPFLNTSLTHLENLSLLPILLGESIACTSFIAASASLDLISHLIDAEDEASFSLSTFVALVRREWAEHGVAGRSVTEVARAVAAWAAVQGFTKQWSEDRLLKSVRELTSEDFRTPDRPAQRQRTQAHRSRNHRLSRVSVTDDIILFGHSGQVVSADIGEREDVVANSSSPANPTHTPSLPPRRSNYETRKTLRRLSKMVLAGYGGPGLLFFGVPLKPGDNVSSSSEASFPNKDTSHGSKRTDAEVKKSEEDILVRAVEDAEAEVMSPVMHNITLPEEKQIKGEQNPVSPPHIGANYDSEPNSVIPSSAYSWWNVLLGKHDREIFEGFAFTPADDSDRDSVRSTYSPTNSRFSRRDSSLIDVQTLSRKDALRKPMEQKPPTAVIGDLGNMPRFWVLTDHGRQQVVLVIRGTMSYNDLAVVRCDQCFFDQLLNFFNQDLHCEPEIFEPPAAVSAPHFKPIIEDLRVRKGEDAALAPDAEAANGPRIPFPTTDDNTEGIPASFRVKTSSRINKRSFASFPHPTVRRRTSIFDMAVEPARTWPPTSEDVDDEDRILRYQVHGGILQLAREMGLQGKPVFEAVCAALARNRGYELVLCGHSLGAGVASLLALMWADPSTCRTIHSSGLPSNRRVSVYCFAPPCITSPALSRLCKNLITSIVYSYDVVSRLSLGHIRDLNKAAYWLCEGQGEESAGSVLRRALKGKISFVGGTANDTEEEKKRFIALRKTLEANMYFAHLFPPGTVWWAVRNEALHPSHQHSEDVDKGIRLFEVLHVEEVFRQIEFKGDMLSSHLPHQYDDILAELDSK